jgi:hypothetical protein
MERPPFSTVLSAAVASAATFFVITRSGIAGTLAGAAVASLVYTGASHGSHRALERLVRGVRRWGHPPTEASMAEARPAISTDKSTEKDGGLLSGTLILPPRALRRPARSVVATWGPIFLAIAALAASLYSITTGTPIERVVVQERVVEKPVVTQRLVIRTQTVTVTQPAPGHEAQPAVGAPTTTTTVAATGPAATTTTIATAPPTTTPTTTTTSTAPPASTTASTEPAP